MHRSALPVLFCWCLCFLLVGSANGLDDKTIRVDRQEAELIHVVDGWAIWRTSKRLENGGSRFSTVEYHFYRQRIPDPNAHLVLHTVEGAGFNPFQAIADDGTLIAVSVHLAQPLQDRHSRAKTWTFRLTLFTVFFWGDACGEPSVWVRVGPSKMEWSVLMKPGVAATPLVFALAFIHNEWWNYS